MHKSTFSRWINICRSSAVTPASTVSTDLTSNTVLLVLALQHCLRRAQSPAPAALAPQYPLWNNVKAPHSPVITPPAACHYCSSATAATTVKMEPTRQTDAVCSWFYRFIVLVVGEPQCALVSARWCVCRWGDVLLAVVFSRLSCITAWSPVLVSPRSTSAARPALLSPGSPLYRLGCLQPGNAHIKPTI